MHTFIRCLREEIRQQVGIHKMESYEIIRDLALRIEAYQPARMMQTALVTAVLNNEEDEMAFKFEKEQYTRD